MRETTKLSEAPREQRRRRDHVTVAEANTPNRESWQRRVGRVTEKRYPEL